VPEIAGQPTNLLSVDGLSKTFDVKRALSGRGRTQVKAVKEVSFSLAPGASLGIVGESGSGKTTIARMLVGLERPTEGQIVLQGKELAARPSRAERQERARAIQIVFQDPYTSLDPHQSVRRALDEVQRVHFSRTQPERATRTQELLDAVGLGEKEATALPRELSGGQRQRVAIARALATEPAILVLDEAVSALDVSIQAQILNLLADLRRELGLTYILISHDLAVVRQIADDVLVMYRGRTVETGPVDTILATPLHPYTQRLLESVPRPGMPLERRTALLDADESGCLFRSRCPHAHERCAEEPALIDVGRLHAARCWLVDRTGTVPAASSTTTGKERHG
jgi:oligopeptide/dipeptide ABC transporter ATP-binding protein